MEDKLNKLLCDACLSEDFKSVKSLIENNDLKDMIEHKNRCLILACIRNNYTIITYLFGLFTRKVRKQIVRNNKSRDLIRWACDNSNYRLVEYFMELGGYTNKEDIDPDNLVIKYKINRKFKNSVNRKKGTSLLKLWYDPNGTGGITAKREIGSFVSKLLKDTHTQHSQQKSFVQLYTPISHARRLSL